uniref:Uncharacterized protein n=1 Tax=Zea mays TaxID=4577 RepID=C4JBM9_MAIZE|nr:unknown [Zea mays]|eukprot:NP_001183862.1 uncharacterized protein LOC100502455 [Zea mays]
MCALPIALRTGAPRAAFPSSSAFSALTIAPHRRLQPSSSVPQPLSQHMTSCAGASLFAIVSQRAQPSSGHPLHLHAIHLQASRNRRSSFDDQVIKLSVFYETEDPDYLFGESFLWCNLCSGK